MRFAATVRMAVGTATVTIMILAGGPPAWATAPAEPRPAAERAWTYLAMGDSNVYGPPENCGSCTTYPILLRTKIPAATGVPLRLLDASQWNKLTAAALLDEIRSDDWGGSSGANPLSRLPSARPNPRTAIAQADIITIQVGFNDLPWLASFDSCKQVYDRACRAAIIPDFITAIDGILTEVDELRDGRDTAVRVATVFNDVITGGYDNSTFYEPAVLAQGRTGVRAFVSEMNRKICTVAARHQARCLDLGRLFNGSRGLRPMAVGTFSPEFGDLNQLGQDLIAKELLRLGWSPLER